MNVFCLAFLGLFMAGTAAAQDCKVYGISDSPQKMSCAFKRLDIKLSCRQGTYFINESRVSQAYHMEVEDNGPVPLVFEAPGMKLTVVINSKTHIEGELEKSGTALFGRCR
jgi:hypothetical protein